MKDNNKDISTELKSSKSLIQEVSNHFMQKQYSEEERKEKFNTIAHLFKVMKGMYGDKFKNQYGNEDAMDIWTIMLWNYNNEIITKAIELTINRHITFAPTLPEFKNICEELASQGNNTNKIDEYYQKLDMEKLTNE